MNGTDKPMPMSHLGKKLLNVIPMLLLVSLGYALCLMTSNDAKLSKLNFSFMPPLSSPTPSSYPLPPPPTTPSSPPPIQHAGLAAFIAPSIIRHNMTDEELLWRASMDPKVHRTPYHRVPKVAFLFLVRGDLPLRPLWEKFFTGHDGLYSIYVHAEPSYIGSPPKDSVFYGRMIPSKETMWGDATLVEAERRLLANALLDHGNERFALVSESCIPVYNFTTMYALLTGSDTSFVDSYENGGSRARYDVFFAQHTNITIEQWRKGAQWFEMDRALALEVVSDGTYFQSFREFCAGRRGCLIDEHYIPTLLNLLGWTRNANRSLTYADWTRPQGMHPHTHEGVEVTDELIKKIREDGGSLCFYNGEKSGICNLFARKFAPDTLQPLLRLAPTVMGFG